MSYINKKGKTTAVRLMTIRQQVSAVLAYGQIETTLTKAKNSQKRLEKLITLAKVDNFNTRRQAASWLLNTPKYTAKELLDHLFLNVASVNLKRTGGYSRVLKLGKRRGDGVEEAILQLIEKPKQKSKHAAKKPKPILKPTTSPAKPVSKEN